MTPYVSLGSYPSPRVGAAVAVRLTPTLSVESEVGYRHDMASRLSATASLLYDLPRIGRVMPYLAAGAGLEEYCHRIKASRRHASGAATECVCDQRWRWSQSAG